MVSFWKKSKGSVPGRTCFSALVDQVCEGCMQLAATAESLSSEPKLLFDRFAFL